MTSMVMPALSADLDPDFDLAAIDSAEEDATYRASATHPSDQLL
jgi:hypothetical protein